MPLAFALIEPIREFFGLRDAERTVRAFAPAQSARIRAHFDAAERRLFAGRQVVQSIPAALLLRDAVVQYLLAIEAARNPHQDSFAIGDLAAALPTVPPDPAGPQAMPTDDERVRNAVSADDPLYFDRLDAEDAERARGALERAASMLRRRVEARTLTNVRGTRLGRRLAVFVIVAYAALVGLRTAFEPPNVAKGKPVSYSSLGGNLTDGQRLVDGVIGTSYGIHTLTEESANVVIDLEDTYHIISVNVHNRVDGWFDECLPLLVELSTDGKTYTELGRREEHFDADPPWVVDGHREPARYVRLRVPRRGYIALSEVEVFGKKKK
jgi:hypothetical protein